MVSDDERSGGAELETDYNGLDIDLTVSAANNFEDDDPHTSLRCRLISHVSRGSLRVCRSS